MTKFRFFVLRRNNKFFMMNPSLNFLSILEFIEEIAMLYEKMLDNLTSQFNEWSEPFTRAQNLTVETIEKITQFQIDRATEYTDMGIEQLKEVTQITTPEALQAYVTKNADLANTLSQNVNDDITNLTQMGGEYFDELSKLTNENLNKIQEMASSIQFPSIH